MLKVGDKAQVTRTVGADAVAALVGLSEDGGPSPASVPEPLIAAMFSYLLGVELPGFGTNYLKQDLTFEAEAPVGEPLTATVEITRLRPDKALVDLATTCTDAAGRVVCRGRALVLALDVDGAFEAA